MIQVRMQLDAINLNILFSFGGFSMLIINLDMTPNGHSACLIICGLILYRA